MLAAVAAMVLLALCAQVCAAADDGEAQFRELYKELVETNTSLSSGSCTLAAERMAARLRSAGFPDVDLKLFTVPDHPKEGGLVAPLFWGKDLGNIRGLNEYVSVKSLMECRDFLYRLVWIYAKQK